METMLICPVCQQPCDENDMRTIAYPQNASTSFAGALPADIHFCPACQAGFVKPVDQAELDRFYQQGQYWDQPFRRLSIHTHPGQFVLAQSRWDLIKPQRPAQAYRILDIGAGQAFLGWIAAKDASVELAYYCAVEADRHLQTSVQQTWAAGGLADKLVVQDSLDDVQGTYNVIVLSHILEHLAQPQAFLKRIMTLLAKGGLLFIDVPHQDYRFKDSVFPHLLFFDVRSLTRLIEACGLALLHIGTYGPSAAENMKGARAMGRLVERSVYRLRRVLPAATLRGYYHRHLQVNHLQDDGLWLRALARR
jgi:2-polyprenyl-3-methyl-5-hydroxy-6-metoxy-1,4-benzoquinol methylase